MDCGIKFQVVDNFGKAHYTTYLWTEESGIPNKEDILENMEECTCDLNEAVSCCEGDCIRFDEGKVSIIGVV